jgi:hypothetical protein
MKKLRADAQSQQTPPQAQGEAAGEVPLVESLTSELKLSFLVREHEYLSDLIKFADQKAAFVFAFAVGAMTVGYTFHLYDALGGRPLAWAADHRLPALGLLLMLGASALSFATLLPRLSSHKSQGLMYFNHLLQHESHGAYTLRVLESDDAQLLREVAAHCYSLAAIVRQKFKWTNRALWTSVFGAILTLAAVAGTFPQSAPAATDASLASVDRAAAAVIAALDLELPPALLSERVATLGTELASIGLPTHFDQHENDLKRFTLAYSTAVQLVKSLNRISFPAVETQHRATSHAAEPPPSPEVLAQMRRDTQQRLEEAHAGFRQTRRKY